MDDEFDSPEMLAAVAVQSAVTELNNAIREAWKYKLRIDINVLEHYQTYIGNRSMPAVEVNVYQKLSKPIKE